MNQRLGSGGRGEVGVLSPSAPGALANLWRPWIREETQLRHGVCLTVTVMSVARLWETEPKVGEGGEKAKGQTGWGAQPYLPMNTCGNHMHTRGHRHRGVPACHLSLSSIACPCMHNSSPQPLSLHTVWLCWCSPGFLQPSSSEHLLYSIAT